MLGVHERLGFAIVTFSEHAETPAGKKGGVKSRGDRRIQQLEAELQYTRENLRSTIEELETANEEMRSANEEYQSTNEELQSANEELETSREELQSVNEELMTVNNEHQSKIEELSVINDDMMNLLNSSNIATIFLDNALQIKRYTPDATRIFNLIGTDVGRPLGHLTSNLRMEGLAEHAQAVLDSLVPFREDVQTRDGHWYSMRLHPYRTTLDAIAGVVISFLDINDYIVEKVTAAARLRVASDFAVHIASPGREAVVVLDRGSMILSRSASFAGLGTAPAEVGQRFYEAHGGAWNTEEVRALLEVEMPREIAVKDRRLTLDLPGIGRRSVRIDGYYVSADDGSTAARFLAVSLDPPGAMKPRRPRAPADLRARAEKLVAHRKLHHPGTYDEVLHELHVHEVELEMQIDELRGTETMLQRLWDRYQSLYDEAPVGYVTLDRSNLITQANRAAVRILRQSKSSLLTKRFSALLKTASQGVFYTVSADVRSKGSSRTFDAELDGIGATTWLQLDLASQPHTGELRVTLIDVTAERVAERKLRDLAQQLITLQEKERSAVASVLHDDAGQQLTYLGLLLDQARGSAEPLDAAHIDELSGITRKILEGIRKLSASLAPAEIGRVGLPGAVRAMIEEFSARTRIPVSFSETGGFEWISPEVALTAYRIVQEALTNAARHAQPQKVRVTLRAEEHRLTIQVHDDGAGFDPKSGASSTGILTMQERARAAGGRLDIQSAPGKGARVTFECPPRRRAPGRSDGAAWPS